MMLSRILQYSGDRTKVGKRKKNELDRLLRNIYEFPPFF